MFLGGVFLALNSIEEHKDQSDAEEAPISDPNAAVDKGEVVKASLLAPQQRSPHAGTTRREPVTRHRREAPKGRDEAASVGERARADVDRRTQRAAVGDRDVAARVTQKLTVPEE